MYLRIVSTIFAMLGLVIFMTGCGGGSGNSDNDAAGDRDAPVENEPDETLEEIALEEIAIEEITIEEECVIEEEVLIEEEQPAEEEAAVEEEALADGDEPEVEEVVEAAEENPTEAEETENWPPTDPWWGVKECKLPACDAGSTVEPDLSGLWTQKLTALSHTCNKMIETFKPDIKPGAVTTNRDQSFVLSGECVYDKVGGTLTGVIHGGTMINCILMPPQTGVIAMPTGWVTFAGASGTGKSTVHLYNVPIDPKECVVEYDVAYTKQ